MEDAGHDPDRLLAETLGRLLLAYRDGYNLFACELGIWIANRALHGTRIEVVNGRPWETDESYDIDQYRTVADFLNEPNGDGEEHFSGGVRVWLPQTLRDEFDDLVEDLLQKWFDENVHDPEILSDFMDVVDHCMLNHFYWHDHFRWRRLREVVERYGDAAGERERQRIADAKREEAERRKREEAERRIADRVHAAVMAHLGGTEGDILAARLGLRHRGPLGPQIRKCDVPCIERLLRDLEPKLGPDAERDLAVYVRSGHVKWWASNSARPLLARLYPTSP